MSQLKNKKKRFGVFRRKQRGENDPENDQYSDLSEGSNQINKTKDLQRNSNTTFDSENDTESEFEKEVEGLYDLKNSTVPTLDYVSTNISDSLICHLCQKPFFDPVDCPCSHTFCSLCITDYLKNSTQPKCPICSQSLNRGDLNPTHILIYNLVNELIVRCSNKLQGCTAEVKRIDLEKHSHECQFRTVSCPNKGCTEKILAKDLEQHLEVCGFKRVVCPNKGCGQIFNSEELQEHLTECLYTLESCQYCNKELIRKNLEIHLKDECLEIVRNCPYFDFGCPFKGKKNELEKHINNECPYNVLSGLIGKNRQLRGLIEQQNQQLIKLRTNYDQLIASIDTEYLVKLKRNRILEVTRVLPELHCKNCNQTFQQRTNNSRNCQYHPGTWNLFEDGKWTCCGNENMNSLGFNNFINERATYREFAPYSSGDLSLRIDM
ncbi:tnf receptor associated factor [Anaeramoeba flamelloides]|uniref:Tnf receptor associated factor n=1 Tax=Anaeramoeba flamelloides TaxID=1746091 RepID=A0ABQ8XWT2_9EUKA|nr:tnf receptor associated factor [Anaeramoeba flamelloides]